MEKEIVAVVPGRSSNYDSSEFGGSVKETAQAVTDAGGTGIPVIIDHSNDDAVGALFGQVRKDYGRLDILVNNAAKLNNQVALPIPFWEKSLDSVDLLTVGLRSHFVSGYYAAPIWLKNSGITISPRSLFGWEGLTPNGPGPISQSCPMIPSRG
jgi:NAD(P)-dependent dehydrogenase (short-subunit alcohol dehydrogenase family)